jgi:ELWxxDGT repeat protein
VPEQSGAHFFVISGLISGAEIKQVRPVGTSLHVRQFLCNNIRKIHMYRRSISLLGMAAFLGIVFTAHSQAQVKEVSSIYPGSTSGIRIFHTGSDVVYFSAVNQTTNSWELWRSDGTPENTKRVVSDLNIRSSEKKDFGYVDDAFYFYAEPAGGGTANVYRYDELTESYELVLSSGSSNIPFPMYVTGRHVYFSVRGASSVELWRARRGVLEQVESDFSDRHAVIEVDNALQARTETYYLNNDGHLMLYTNSTHTDIFSTAGFVDGFTELLEIYEDMFTIHQRKFIFFGRYAPGAGSGDGSATIGVFALDLESYALEVLVEYPHQAFDLRSFDPTTPEENYRPFISIQSGVYFLTVDASSQSRLQSNQINNIVLYSSDGTPSGTYRQYEFKDPAPNPFSSAVANVRMHTIEGNKLIVYSNRADGDFSTPEVVALDLDGFQESVLWDFPQSGGQAFGFAQDYFTAGYAVYGSAPSAGSGYKLITSNGTSEGTVVQATTTDGLNYEVIPNYFAVISDSVFVFAAKVNGSSNMSLMTFTYSCDGGCEGSGGSGGSGSGGSGNTQKVAIYTEDFDYSNPEGYSEFPDGWTFSESFVLGATVPDTTLTWREVNIGESALVMVGTHPEFATFTGEEDMLEISYLDPDIIRISESIVSPSINIEGREALSARLKLYYGDAAFDSATGLSFDFYALVEYHDGTNSYKDYILLYRKSSETSLSPNGQVIREIIEVDVPVMQDAQTLQFVLEAQSLSTLSGLSLGKFRIGLAVDSLQLFDVVQNVTSVESTGHIPTEPVLQQNYPNPFNPSTDISFSLPVAGQVRLEVFNMMGQRVATLVEKILSAGTHSVQFNASDLVTGMYIYRLTGPGFMETRKMILLK